MKKLCLCLLILALIAATTLAMTFSAAADGTVVQLTIGSTTAYVNGQAVTLDVAPVIEGGRTLMPLRFIAEAVGAEVAWNGATSTATLTRGAERVVVTLGSTTAYVGGVAKTLDVPAASRNGRTLLPVRFIAESFGAEVSWDGATSTATFIAGGASAPTAPDPRYAAYCGYGEGFAQFGLSKTEQVDGGLRITSFERGYDEKVVLNAKFNAQGDLEFEGTHTAGLNRFEQQRTTAIRGKIDMKTGAFVGNDLPAFLEYSEGLPAVVAGEDAEWNAGAFEAFAAHGDLNGVYTTADGTVTLQCVAKTKDTVKIEIAQAMTPTGRVVLTLEATVKGDQLVYTDGCLTAQVFATPNEYSPYDMIDEKVAYENLRGVFEIRESGIYCAKTEQQVGAWQGLNFTFSQFLVLFY